MPISIKAILDETKELNTLTPKGQRKTAWQKRKEAHYNEIKDISGMDHETATSAAEKFASKKNKKEKDVSVSLEDLKAAGKSKFSAEKYDDEKWHGAKNESINQDLTKSGKQIKTFDNQSDWLDHLKGLGVSPTLGQQDTAFQAAEKDGHTFGIWRGARGIGHAVVSHSDSYAGRHHFYADLKESFLAPDEKGPTGGQLNKARMKAEREKGRQLQNAHIKASREADKAHEAKRWGKLGHSAHTAFGDTFPDADPVEHLILKHRDLFNSDPAKFHKTLDQVARKNGARNFAHMMSISWDETKADNPESFGHLQTGKEIFGESVAPEKMACGCPYNHAPMNEEDHSLEHVLGKPEHRPLSQEEKKKKIYKSHDEWKTEATKRDLHVDHIESEKHSKAHAYGSAHGYYHHNIGRGYFFENVNEDMSSNKSRSDDEIFKSKGLSSHEHIKAARYYRNKGHSHDESVELAKKRRTGIQRGGVDVSESNDFKASFLRLINEAALDKIEQLKEAKAQAGKAHLNEAPSAIAEAKMYDLLAERAKRGAPELGSADELVRFAHAAHQHAISNAPATEHGKASWLVLKAKEHGQYLKAAEHMKNRDLDGLQKHMHSLDTSMADDIVQHIHPIYQDHVGYN